MRTIAIINQKGGCGKTTCSINLAATLAAKGRRTLLVDMDPQSHCALGLAVPDAQIDRGMPDILRAGMDGSIAFADVVWQIARNFDLAPSTMALAGIEQQLASAHDRDRRLVQVLSTVQDKYEFCIIDCPPSIGLLTFNALRAADEVLIPVETGYFAMQGSIKQEQTIQMLARRAGHQVRFKVLATMYDVRTKLAREILSELKKQFDDQLLPVVINFNSKLKEAASFGQPITEYDAASRGMQDFERLAAWLLENPPKPRTDVFVTERGEAFADPITAAPSSNPALSRAAELVERAKALTARTNAITGKLNKDPDMEAEQIVPRVAPIPEPDYSQPSQDSNQDRLKAKLARIYGVRSTSRGLLFVQPGDIAGNVAIAADFNDWNPSQTPMSRDKNLGIWQAVVKVPPGRYRYRLVFDGEWKQDPHNDIVETNPYGELNNVALYDQVAAPATV
ncbi:Soj-like protein [Poriferisphaera corsica]|uniref:Soj-like protein n=1 Tax=Poriferisphaera corsica TaxID=2528020 RepID=A0A517YZC7_9BACT|nr:AAA family ATPase [Poriferisphaera corsica]QDU35587.1 Soj-like protein [Poriferisphaera corsica]